MTGQVFLPCDPVDSTPLPTQRAKKGFLAHVLPTFRCHICKNPPMSLLRLDLAGWFRGTCPGCGPLSSEYGTHKTVKARFWPWLSGKSLMPFELFPLRSAVVPVRGHDRGLCVDLCRTVQWFRGGLVCEAHRLVYHPEMVMKSVPNLLQRDPEHKQAFSASRLHSTSRLYIR